MPYASATVARVERLPHGQQRALAVAAINCDLPIVYLAQALGATRWTVYRWFKGFDVSPAYRQRVAEVTDILKQSKDKDEAWTRLAMQYALPVSQMQS